MAGDRLYCDVYVHSIRQAHGTDIIVTKNVITNQDGEVVQETTRPWRVVRAMTAERDFSDGAT